LMAEQVSLADFEFGASLGEGAFARVFTAKKAGKDVAIKVVARAGNDTDRKKAAIFTEKNILQKCDHPNIIRLLRTFRDDENLYFVFDLLPNGDLRSRIRKHEGLSIPVVQFYTAEIILGLQYLHTTIGAIHRNLCPDSLLLDEKMHIVLADFTQSKLVSIGEGAPRRGSFVGSVEIMPPEMWSNSESSFALDLWSLGCTVYQMISNKPAFQGRSEYLTGQMVVQYQPGGLTYPLKFELKARNLIEALLQPDPTQRLGANNYEELKGHPFFSDIHWDSLNAQVPPEMTSHEKIVWP